jgi:serine/threonine-protein kinase
VALKLLSAQLAADERFCERFIRESRLAAAIEHPGVVPIYEAGDIGGVLYLAMRYVDGRDLGAILRSEGALAPERAVALVEQLANALDVAHAAGLIHRDVKPANTLVSSERGDERVYLVDFGITQDITSPERLTESGQLVGSVDYVAPERIRGDPIDGRADVYSLGCVLYQCLTGEVPFPRDSDMTRIYAHLQDEPPSASERRPGIPPALDAVVVRALAKEPEERWQSCGELAEAARSALAGTAPVAPTPPRRAPPRRRRVLLAGGLALALAGIAVGVVALTGGDERSVGPPSGGQVVAIDAAKGRVTGRLAAGRTPTALASDGSGRLWMIDADARTLLRLDTETGVVESTATGATPIDVAIGAGGVWVANGTPRKGNFSLGPTLDKVVRLDPATQSQEAEVPTPPRGDLADANGVDSQVAVLGDAVWVVKADGSVVRVDGPAARVAASPRRIRAFAVAAGGAGVWALAQDGSVVPLDPRTGRPGRRVRIPGGVDGLAVGDTTVWATSAGEGKLWRIVPGERSVPGSVEVGSGATDVAATRRAVWIANPGAGTVTQVDPVEMRVVRVIEVGGTPRSLATDGRTMWAATTGVGAAPARSAAGVRTLPPDICEPVVAGNGGKADLLIASDLPLLGDSRLEATQMAQAIQFVLRERRFRAGRFRLAYQSCNDALPATGRFDFDRCASNGRAYARDPDVVAVLGSFNSVCAIALLPELNRARGGPVPMISAVNTYVGLTREADQPGLLGELYPTGKRSFARIFPADDLQGAALAEFAHRRGRERAFILEDDATGYSDLVADAFTTVAERRGLEIAGRVRWDQRRDSYAGLAQRVKASGADAVLVSGLVVSNAGRLVKDLRSRLGRRVDILAPDGLVATDLFDAAGASALGVYLTYQGLTTNRLPPAGDRFLERFARSQPGVEVGQYAVYAAQTAETLLAAIARSDGTRASVLEQLLRARDSRGLVGEVGFDERGDIREGVDTIVRVVGGKRGTGIQSLSAVVVEDVIPVTPAMVE